MTALRVALALLAAGLAAPAVARPQAQLDCAVRRVPAGLGANLAAAMVAGDRARLGPLQETLERAMRPCVAANRMNDSQAEAYYDYLLARLPREALARQLTSAGIPATRIDAAMDFGPGRPNKPMRERDEAETDRANASLVAAGINETRLPAQTWRKVMTYIDLTPRMYRALRDLG